MTWNDILGGLIKLVVGRPTYRPPVKPPPAPAPVPVPTDPSPTVPAPDGPTAAALYRAINAARQANGRPMLAIDPLVSAVAAAWAARMAGTGVLDHGNFGDRVASVRPRKAAGEDIGEGYPNATAEVQAWVDHPPHRAILLGNYNAVGCGVAVSRDGSLFWVADFLLD